MSILNPDLGADKLELTFTKGRTTHTVRVLPAGDGKFDIRTHVSPFGFVKFERLGVPAAESMAVIAIASKVR